MFLNDYKEKSKLALNPVILNSVDPVQMDLPEYTS